MYSGAAHPITLTASDQVALRAVLRRGTTATRVITHARILLKLADPWTDPAIASALEVSRSTLGRIRARFLEGGLAAVPHDLPRSGQPPVLTPAQGAHLIALACTPSADGHDHWTLRLLAGKAVELGFVAHISPETIRQLLKKRAEVLARGAMVHPRRGCRLCRRHGRRARLVRRVVGSGLSDRLPR